MGVRPIEPAVRIKLTMKDGTVIDVEEDLEMARRLLPDVPQDGFRDPESLWLYPADAIRTIEVMPPDESPTFSDN